jgi:hypothetical protein
VSRTLDLPWFSPACHAEVRGFESCRSSQISKAIATLFLRHCARFETARLNTILIIGWLDHRNVYTKPGH